MNKLTYEQLVKAYEEGGCTAVEKLCEPHDLPRAWCVPCETETPTFENACACCGTERPVLKKFNVYVTRVSTYEVEAANSEAAIDIIASGQHPNGDDPWEEETTDIQAQEVEP